MTSNPPVSAVASTVGSVTQTDSAVEELRLSVSKVKTFSDCQKKYRFTYLLKLPRKSFDFHIFGQFVHQVLEDFHQAYLDGATEPTATVMGRVFKRVLSDYKDRLSDEHKREGYDIIDRYLQRLAADQFGIQNVIAVEKKFAIHLTDQIVLNGMIDKVQRDPDGVLTIVDYKTTKNRKWLSDPFQLLVYSYVMWCEDPTITRVRGAYSLLRHNFDRIETEFSLDQIMSVRDKFEDYARQIEVETEWRPNPTQLCAYCDHLSLCDEGRALVNPMPKTASNSWT